MYNTKLIQVLKALDKNELKYFKDFVHSPFHNKNKRAISFLDYLLKYAPQFEHKALEADYIYTIFFKEKLPSLERRKKITQLTNQLFKLLKDFLAHYSLKKDIKTVDYQIRILDFYRQKDIDNLFQYQQKEVLKLHEQESKYDADYYYHGFEIQKYLLNYYSRKQDRKAIDSLRNILPIISYYINTYKEVVQLELEMLSINFSRILKDKDKTTKIFSTQEGEQMINIYRHVVAFLRNPASEAAFLVYKDFLQKHILDISNPAIARQLYAYAINYCITKIRQGESDYYKQLFELYQSELQHKENHFKDTKIQAANLRTIIFTAIIIKELDWSIDFLEKYKDQIIVDDNHSMYPYCKALILFYQNKYQESLHYLNQVDFKNPINKLALRRLMIKLWYKMDEIDRLANAINAFRGFLFHSKSHLSDQNRNANRQFNNIMEKIMNLPPHAPNRKQQLIEEVQNSTELAERLWLLEILGDK